ncbi:M14 family zinc carboxypeptidase [Phytoactinopolyspora limicola]|uniref:M14 family zinc carboxypeptidase n=1 Tax=Phytoactinopolyspora limicola TaxID=2715536 RepID=UPI001409EC12|nr:M14 family zinc carboxypeptidase [Phytoactinopolyspora limicola]
MGIATVLGLTLLAGPAASADDADTGTVYSTDFSEHPAGPGVPDGWAEHWGSSHYEIAESPSRLVKTSIGDVRHLLAWEDVGVVEGDVEVATLVRQPQSTLPWMDITRFQLHLHASGEAGAIDAYFVDDTGTDRQGVRIRRSVNHAQSTRASNSGPAFDMHTWHHVVFQRRGDALRVKVWPYFDDEPDEWTVEATDGTHHSGRVGVGYFGARVTQEFAWYSVGVGDEDAERAPAGIDGIAEPAVPVAPSAQATPDHGAVLLNWDEVAGADHYEIERDGEPVALGWEVSSFADAELPPGASATYRVRGINALLGAGEWSAPVDITADPLPDEHRLEFEVEPDHPWTSHEEELAFLADIAAASDRMDYEEIGRSGEDRPIHLVRIGRDGPPDDHEIADRPTVLITGGNHGNEQAGRKGVLLLLRELATSTNSRVTDWLDTYTVLVVPTINPDGQAADTRNLVIPNIDPNRDFLDLTSRETRTVIDVLRDHRPDVVIDAHEWAGSPGHHRGEMELNAMGNYNTHPDLLDLSGELFDDYVMTRANNVGGWRSGHYQERYGQPTRLRQITGLKHALSLLTESSRHPEVRRVNEVDLSRDDPRTRPRRVASQRFVLSEAMDFLTDNVDRVSAATAESVAVAEANQGPMYTDGDLLNPPGPEQTLDPPVCGWIIPERNGGGVGDVLDHHGIEWKNRPVRGGQLVTFVPAAQWARPVAIVALDPDSPYRLDGITTERLPDSGWCRRGRPFTPPGQD